MGEGFERKRAELAKQLAAKGLYLVPASKLSRPHPLRCPLCHHYLVNGVCPQCPPPAA